MIACQITGQDFEICECTECNKRRFLDGGNWYDPVPDGTPMAWLYEKFKTELLSEIQISIE